MSLWVSSNPAREMIHLFLLKYLKVKEKSLPKTCWKYYILLLLKGPPVILSVNSAVSLTTIFAGPLIKTVTCLSGNNSWQIHRSSLPFFSKSDYTVIESCYVYVYGKRKAKIKLMKLYFLIFIILFTFRLGNIFNENYAVYKSCSIH